MDRLPDGLQAEIDAEVEAAVRATVGRYYEPLIGHKRQEVEAGQRELEALESEYSQAISRYVERLRGEGLRNGPPRLSTSEQGTVDRSQQDHAPQNGSRDLPTRRKMLLSVLRDFDGDTFKRRDADTKIIEKWPEVEPQDETELKTFRAAIAGLLSDLVDKGKLDATKGERRFDPTVYRVIDNDEDTLLRSGP